MISLIVAASENGVIGVDGKLPWRLSDDLKKFKALTMGKPIIMGRKTWESLGKPLPGRQNIVISRNDDFNAEGCDVVRYPAAALVAADGADEIMVIGGGEIYQAFVRVAKRVYLTRVHTVLDGDTVFPQLHDEQWRRVDAERHEADEANEYAFTFERYERKVDF